jgi:SAM-dependent methyltransferase
MNEVEAYEWRVGKWSRLVGEAVVSWLDKPQGLRWLDVGCGAGALSEAILRMGKARQLVGIDTSIDAIELARRTIGDSRADFRVGSAEKMSFADESFDVVASGLCLNWLEQPLLAMKQMRRVVMEGGCITAYVWDFAGEMQVLRRYWDAASVVDVAAKQADQGPRFPLCQPSTLRQLFVDAGLTSVEVGPVDVLAQFPSFETYWDALTTGDGSTAQYANSISSSQRAAVRETLRDTLSLEANGSFNLIARAWAVRGTRALPSGIVQNVSAPEPGKAV